MSESVWPTEGVNIIHEHVTTAHAPVTLESGQLYQILGTLVERSTVFGDAVTYTHIVQPVTLGKAVHDMMEQNSKPEPFNAGGQECRCCWRPSDGPGYWLQIAPDCPIHMMTDVK